MDEQQTNQQCAECGGAKEEPFRSLCRSCRDNTLPDRSQAMAVFGEMTYEGKGVYGEGDEGYWPT